MDKLDADSCGKLVACLASSFRFIPVSGPPPPSVAAAERGLGYELTPTTVGGLPSFEISGWSRGWLEAFPTRRQDIMQHMADEGRAYTTANAQAAALVTRGKKAEPVRG